MEDVAAALEPWRAAGCRRFNLMAVAGSEEASVDAIGEIARLLRDADRRAADAQPSASAPEAASAITTT